MFSIFSLPQTIDKKVAAEAFRSHRGSLINLISYSLPLLTNSLVAEKLISRDVKEQACNENHVRSLRAGNLLDCVEKAIEAVPDNFAKVIHILRLEESLEEIINDVIKSYSEWL